MERGCPTSRVRNRIGSFRTMRPSSARTARTRWPLATIGQYRADEPSRRKAISDVLATANSDNRDNNSEVAVLNQIANANALNAQNTQSANALFSAILEEMILDQTQRRQVQAVAVNSDVYFRQNAAATLSRHTTATTQALQNLRIP